MIDAKTGDVKYGLARALRDALPEATFLAFTGTPISHDDRDTQAVFGSYVSIYDIQRAVLDMLNVVAGTEALSSAQAKFNRRLRALEDESALDWSALEGVSVLRRPQGTLSQHFAKRYYLPAVADVPTEAGVQA